MYEELIKVEWSEDRRMWRVSWRNAADEDWDSDSDGESHLDVLLSIARDAVTGG